MNRLKNHILPRGRRLSQVMRSKFGVSLDDFDRALNGDIQAAEKIG